MCGHIVAARFVYEGFCYEKKEKKQKVSLLQ